MLIDRAMPEFDVSERYRILVSAPTDRVFEAVRRVDLARSSPIRALFGLRGLAVLLIRRGGRGPRRTMTLDDLVRAGFVVLEEDPGEEIVLGVVGTFWRPRGGIRRIRAEAFAAFDEPGIAKAAWNFRVVPAGEEGSVVATETRVRCTDDASRKKFVLYWAVVGPFSGVVLKQALQLVKHDAELGT